MSDYEWLVELAAKGMAERDDRPMPKSVTTPEAFYEIMARAALDAIGLPALLEELARAEQELKKADERTDLVVNADVATTIPEEPNVSAEHVLSVPPPTGTGDENAVLEVPSRREGERGKAENARLRHK